MSSQYFALTASGSRVDLSDRKASSQVRMPSSRVIVKIAMSLRPYDGTQSLIKIDVLCLQTFKTSRKPILQLQLRNVTYHIRSHSFIFYPIQWPYAESCRQAYNLPIPEELRLSQPCEYVNQPVSRISYKMHTYTKSKKVRP